MMSLFTHGKKILGVKGSKPNFTSKDVRDLTQFKFTLA